jgi:hypothetical protein
MDLKIESGDSSLTAKVNIKFHQFFSDAHMSITRMHRDLEKLGFFCNIPKTDKTDHRMFGFVLSPHHITVPQRIPHFPDEHISRPRGKRVGTLYEEDLLQVFGLHLLNGNLFRFQRNSGELPG